MGSTHHTKDQLTKLREHHTFLGTLRAGDKVTLTMDSRDLELTVGREIHSIDPGGYGHPHSSRVTVGYGLGRWNVDVEASSLLPKEAHGSGWTLRKGWDLDGTPAE